MKKTFEMDFCGRKLIVEQGEIAKQADGAVLVRYGDTVVLSTVVVSKEARLLSDFFPLMVLYQEKLYSVGKIPGGFIKREGRPSEAATLAARMIDRPMRPLFPDDFRNEVQIVNTILSVDPDNSPELAALLGSSIATSISKVPFNGPVAGVKVGRVNGKFVINPTTSEAEESDIDLTVAGTKEAINMVESSAKEVKEEDMLDALMFGHEAVKKLVEFEENIVKEIGQEKMVYEKLEIASDLKEEVTNLIKGDIDKALRIKDKLEKYAALDKIKDNLIDKYEKENEDMHIDELEKLKAKLVIIYNEVEYELFRQIVVKEHTRADGRAMDEIRPLSASVDFLPRTHGSALFTRGQTQVISITTLGPKDDEQIIDNLTPEETKRFIHHYNFPPFSVGEIGRTGTPGRREIGHGALGERALSYVIPSEDVFPYTIRVVSEVVESNGSSSQASICAGCMSLMAAGVPIKDMVSGIAMGLVTSGPLDGNHPYTILTDIQGLEDHFGDMDFKVAGTKNGITALQMDIKIKGITKEILKEALAQANKARAKVREVMMTAIAEPRKTLSKYTPKFGIKYIDVDKIKDVIGSGGKTINDIIDKCDGVKIDISDEGRVLVYHMNQESIDKALKMIDDITREAQIGEIYEGVVTRVEDYGAFVNLFGDVDGLCHVSQLGNGYVKKASDLVRVGETLKVKVIGFDPQGKIKLSHKEFTNANVNEAVDTKKEADDSKKKKKGFFGKKK